MSLLDLFKRRPPSANIARERLQIIVAHERRERDAPSYLPQLKKDILQVIRKYASVDSDAVTVNLAREDRYEVLELSIALPEPE